MSHRETKRIWNALANWWDDKIGDGNDFQRELIDPSITALLALQSNDRVLDIACGAGRYARIMAGSCAHVTACDFSEAFIARARERTTAEGISNIDFSVVDATSTDELMAIIGSPFDAVTCTMALMDMSDIDPLFSTLPKLLKKDGRFVFTQTHPCFHSPGVTRYAEGHEDERGRSVNQAGVKVWRYKTDVSYLGEGIIGQPEPQYYFHRSLESILGSAFNAGFVMDGLLEPTFQETPRKSFGWNAMPDIPPMIAVRLRVL